jgi:hypothetical protein
MDHAIHSRDAALPNLTSHLRLRRSFLFTTVLTYLALSPAMRAVTPAPDGGYPAGNTAEGDFALFSLTTGQDNTATGLDALFRNTTGNANTATGAEALVSNTTGAGNTASGSQALFSNTTASFNTANGYNALYSNKTGTDNTANGAYALQSNTTGHDNTAIGLVALMGNATGMDNTAMGAGALSTASSSSFNTAIGFNALGNNTASNNTATGFEALFHNTLGTENTATGGATLFANMTGNNNTASGFEALFSNTSGSNNTADGLLALENNTTGHDNMAVGFEALANNKSGSSNIALGSDAGINLTTGSNNIDIGASGVAAEANTIRIGKSGTQNRTFIVGISGKTVANGVGVIVGPSGQLGTVQSSARYKQDIKPMDKASELLLKLKPVTFRYKEELDPDKIPQFGLIAEEVEKVDPDLVVKDEEGKVSTVRYEAVNAMLLNEFLKEHRRLEEQRTEFEAKFAQQQKLIETLTAAVRNVSDQVEVCKHARQFVVNGR